MPLPPHNPQALERARKYFIHKALNQSPEPLKPLTADQLSAIPSVAGLPDEVANYPRFRFMGSNFRLLPWIHDTLSDLPFTTATVAFCNSGVVSCLLKAMDRHSAISSTGCSSNENVSFVAHSMSDKANAPGEAIFVLRLINQKPEWRTL